MIETTVKFNLNEPTINFQKDLQYVANMIIIPEMAKGINNQIGIDESPFPALEPATIKAKAKQGLSPKILIATGKLFSSFLSRTSGKDKVVIFLKDERALIGKYLQVDGVGKKNKHFNFFGISIIMESRAIAYMKKRIKEILNARK